MLRIHTVTSATEAKKYYRASDYYAEGQETVGQWGGRLAAASGLQGTVDPASFDRLCDNLHPQSAGQLTLRTNAARRVGYDFVFSAPKSFSVLEALAGPQDRPALRDAFDQAVHETMEQDIEPDMMARVRKGGAFTDRRTGNMLWARFDHATARPVGDHAPDPQRHAHVLVFNATEDAEEGCIKAGEFSSIKRDGEYYTALFYSRLARKLEALGYAVDRRGGKAWEIAGVPQSVIDTFSKRTGEVEAEHADRMRSDPGYRSEFKHELGAKTRAGKRKELGMGELRSAWDGQLTENDRQALAAVYRRDGSGSAPVSPQRAVAFATGHCFEKESLVPERQLVATALFHGLGHVTPEGVRSELEQRSVLTGELDGRLMATAGDVRREEEFIVTWAGQGLGTVAPVGVPAELEQGKLDIEQWAAVRGLLSTTDRVSMVDSAAGTGKSTMLAAYDRGMKLAGERVTYLGTTAPAVGVLRGDGLEADTVARFLVDTKMQATARGGRVVIDEASMLGHKEAYRLFQMADELDLSLVFLGDQRQHASVPRGALMRILQEYGGIRPFRLTGIKRQQDAGYLAAVKDLSEGKPVEGFDALARKGWVREIEDAADRCRQMAADYVQALEDGKSVLVVSPTHGEAARITAEIRSRLRQAGRLGAEEREFTRLEAVDASEAERGQPTTYRPGDVIQFHQNAPGHAKGERITVTDPATVPLDQAARFSLYRPQAIRLTAGDILRFTGTVATWDGEHKLRNGDFHTVAEFTPGGNIRLENGWVVGKDAGHFRPGFVATSFGSQGRTVQRVILGMSSASLPAINQEQMYVSASRAREQLRLYTDDADAVRDAIRHSSAKRAALDLAPPAPLALPDPDDDLRLYREHRRRQEFSERWRAQWDAPDVSRRQLVGTNHAERLRDGHELNTHRGR